jgi:TP901-1 family phage major tail protein
MANSEVLGVDVLIKEKSSSSYVAVGGQRGAALSISADSIDLTNKVDSTWRRGAAGYRSWTVSCDGLVVPSDTAYGLLKDAAMYGSSVLVEIAMGTDTLYGEAYITAFDVDAPYDDAATYSITLQGTDALSGTAPT